MNEKNIRSFSLATLLEANTLRPGDLYYDGCVIASRVDVTDEFNIGLFRYPTRLNAFAIVFCSKGSITFTSGLRHHTLKERTLFVHLPGSILQMESVERESSVYAVMCEEEFNQFMKELARHYMQHRSVGFYAAQLHLTPKYLTTIIRKTTGRTASDWIDDYVVLEAKNLLKYSTMSIQEVAYYLSFPNQSFFGKYFKEHTGLTPTAYRTGK